MTPYRISIRGPQLGDEIMEEMGEMTSSTNPPEYLPESPHHHSTTPWGSPHAVVTERSNKIDEEEPACKYSSEMSPSPTEKCAPPPLKLELPNNGHPPPSIEYTFGSITPEAQIGLPDILKPRYFFGWRGALPT